jgi:hypothetical protein
MTRKPPTDWTRALDLPGLSQETLLELALKKAELDEALSRAEGQATRSQQDRARRQLEVDFEAAQKRVQQGLPAIPPAPSLLHAMTKSAHAVMRPVVALARLVTTLWRLAVRHKWMTLSILVIAALVALIITVVVYGLTHERAPKTEPLRYEAVCYDAATKKLASEERCEGGDPTAAVAFYPFARWADGSDHYPGVLSDWWRGPLPAGGVDQLPVGACSAGDATFFTGKYPCLDGIWG